MAFALLFVVAACVYFDESILSLYSLRFSGFPSSFPSFSSRLFFKEKAVSQAQGLLASANTPWHRKPKCKAINRSSAEKFGGIVF